MAEVGIKELLEAGVHFGHQTRRWNPSMRRYIYGERDGIHIIDLLQTDDLLTQATHFASETARKGGVILFVGTKKQARDSVKEWAEKCGMPYVNRRWLGGLLTNFNTIKQRIKRLHELHRAAGGRPARAAADQGAHGRCRPSWRSSSTTSAASRDMERLPDAVFIIDLKTEEIGAARGRPPADPDHRPGRHQLRPDRVDYVIPGNDDAIRSCDLIVSHDRRRRSRRARGIWRAEEERKRAEEEERRREEEERAQARGGGEGKQEAEEASARGRGRGGGREAGGRRAGASGAGGRPAGRQPAQARPDGAGRGTPPRPRRPRGRPPRRAAQTPPEATPGVTEAKAPSPRPSSPRRRRSRVQEGRQRGEERPRWQSQPQT